MGEYSNGTKENRHDNRPDYEKCISLCNSDYIGKYIAVSVYNGRYAGDWQLLRQECGGQWIRGMLRCRIRGLYFLGPLEISDIT